MSETLLQLLVFEHATGDVTIHVEVGSIQLYYGLVLHAGAVHNIFGKSEVREAIDKAVAEQYGREPEPPYIEKREFDYVLVWADSDHGRVLLGGDGSMNALNYIANKELPVVDASESQVKSDWVKVFPPEVTTQYGVGQGFNRWWDGVKDEQRRLQKEPAFTVWRLTVTR